MLLVISIQVIVTSLALLQGSFGSIENGLTIVAVTCTLSFLVEALIWWKMSGELFSPYMVFFGVLFIFSCGQSIGWATGLELGNKNLFFWPDHGLNHALLLYGLAYSMLSVSLFQLGAIWASDTFRNEMEGTLIPADKITLIFSKLGKILLFFY